MTKQNKNKKFQPAAPFNITFLVAYRASSNTEQPERDISAGETPSAARAEETSILREKISRLETELSISAELAERWHRLAEDRLRHMDSTRERYIQYIYICHGFASRGESSSLSGGIFPEASETVFFFIFFCEERVKELVYFRRLRN